MSPAVGVVTDSTAGVAAWQEPDVAFAAVPLTVTMGEEASPEEPGLAPRLAEAMSAGEPVGTSMPSVGDFADTYRGLVAQGCRGLVSVHLSGGVSGTVDSARAAAAAVMAEEPSCVIAVVDSLTTGAGLTAAARRAAHLLREGVDTQAAAARIEAWCRASTRMWFLPDTLEHLRRGGRIGAASALLGQALAIRPILTLADGVVTPVAKVRTSARARARLGELAAESAREWSGQGPEVVVQHLGADDAAQALAGTLRDDGCEASVRGISAVLAAHVGPGVLAVTVSALGPPA